MHCTVYGIGLIAAPNHGVSNSKCSLGLELNSCIGPCSFNLP